MRVDIESGKYTYIFEDGRARLLRYGEPTSRDVVGDKLIYCMAAEISELRQQVTLLRDALNMWLVSPQGERNSAMHETECVKSTLKALAATEQKP